MYLRSTRHIFNASTKLTKQKFNESAKLIFFTSLTVPKLLACTNQYSVKKFSSNRESLNKHLSSEDLSKRQLDDSDDEYGSDGENESFQHYKNLRSNPKDYFDEKDEEKLNMLLKDNPELQRLKKIIQLELIVMEQDGECVPSKLDDRDWLQVLLLKSKARRRKFYKYLFLNEKMNEKTKKIKEERQIELERIREERKNAPPSEEIEYGFGKNFMLRRISNMYINQQLQWNCLSAIMWGNKLVFDCSYDSYMSMHEAKSCAKQMNESYAANRVHNYPFEIFLTNINRSNMLMDSLHRFIPILYEKDFPFTVTEKSYLELFDRSKLCYLSPNAPNELEEYDPETIYIIGAFVDKGEKKPVSFSKARKEGIRMAKLPLDRYLQFGISGSRDLTLNQMCSIMLDIQCKSWPEALKHVPVRKLQNWQINALENKIQFHNQRYEDREHHNQNYQRDSRESIQKSSDEIYSSAPVADFSHSARSKLRERWNK